VPVQMTKIRPAIGAVATLPNSASMAAIGNAVLAETFPFGNKRSNHAILRSKNAAIKCLAAASVIHASEQDPPKPVRDCIAALTQGGIAPSDAIWMAGVRIKNTIHQRYRIEHELPKVEARLA
jgi:hypothetical protein